MKKSSTFTLLCGLWAFGLGLRFVIEFYFCDSGWLHIPKHPLNIYFDFFPLCVFGLITVIIVTRDVIAQIRGVAYEST